MDLFSFDTAGDNELLKKDGEVIKSKILGVGSSIANPSESIQEIFKLSSVEEDEEDKDEDNEDYGGLPPPSVDISHIINKALAASSDATTTSISGRSKENKEKKRLNDFMESMGWNDNSNIRNKSNKKELPELNIDTSFAKTNINDELQKSKLNGIEKSHAIENPSNRKAKELRKQERLKTKGKEWFNMPATELTEEVENDLKILQMRSALDPKHFYKKNDLKVLPKYFQIGTVQHSPLDHYHERDTRRNKKRTIVDELMADAEFQKYNKRKHNEIMQKNQKTAGYYKALKKMKKLKKR